MIQLFRGSSQQTKFMLSRQLNAECDCLWKIYGATFPTITSNSSVTTLISTPSSCTRSTSAQPAEGKLQYDAARNVESPYPTYKHLSSVQKGAVAVFSALGAAFNPRRADLVAALGETTGTAAFTRMKHRMQSSVSGQKILEEQPRITNAVLEAAARCPPGSFGHAYSNFMGRRNFFADDRPPVRFIGDPGLAYVAQRARETHDLWHVLFGCPTTVLGELSLKAVEFAQTGLPMAALSVLGAQWRLTSHDRQILHTKLLPWAIQAGSRCADLMCLYYEQHFREDLAELRGQWRITVAPKVPLEGVKS